MPTSTLNEEYKRLRSELEHAYAAPVWNSVQIDRITNALAHIQRTLLRCRPFQASGQPVKALHGHQRDMTRV